MPIGQSLASAVTNLNAHFRTSSVLYGEGQERARKRPTRWLCCEAAANESLLTKFPGMRENTGSLIRIRPPGDAGHQPLQGIAGGIPY
jgi:hypothetical protein